MRVRNRIKYVGTIIDNGAGAGTLTLKKDPVPAGHAHTVYRISATVEDTGTDTALSVFIGDVDNANFVTSAAQLPAEYESLHGIFLNAADFLTMVASGGVIGKRLFVRIEYEDEF